MRALALAALVALPAAAGGLDVPSLTGPVVDAAGLLDRAEVRRLEALSRAARAAEGGTGVELQYLLVRSLEGEPIEAFSIRVAEAWQLGSKGKGNGVLVVVAVEDRAVRIEVGQGIEGGLTDAQSSRLIRGTIVPAFREGRYGDGLHDAGVQILSALGALPRDVARSAARPSPGGRLGGLGFVGLFVLFIVLRALFFGFSGRRRRGFWGGGGPFIGGGFSGGGASGRW